MAIFSRIITSAAAAAVFVAISLTDSANALVTPDSSVGHIAARHLGVTPVHQSFNRKRNTHKLRKRCVQRPAPSTTPPTTGNTNNGVTTPNTTTPPSTYVPTGPSNGSKKLGLAWPNGDNADMQKYITDKTSYYYTWSPYCNKNNAGPLKCAPMIWSWKQQSEFEQLVVPGYADVVLGPNEVNEPSQANMSVGDGVNLWRQLVVPKRAQGYRLGSPATTSAPSGLAWIKDFLLQLGPDEKPDFLCLHWYDVGVDHFKNYITNFRAEAGGNLNVWVTEFACQNFNGGAQCSRDDIFNFANEVTAWMDATDWIEVYFPFGFMHDMVNVNYDNQLMDGSGGPTDLGRVYLS